MGSRIHDINFDYMRLFTKKKHHISLKCPQNVPTNTSFEIHRKRSRLAQHFTILSQRAANRNFYHGPAKKLLVECVTSVLKTVAPQVLDSQATVGQAPFIHKTDASHDTHICRNTCKSCNHT